MTNKIKYYNSSMRAAPVKNGTPGSFITVLDAVCVNGFGQVNAVSASIVGGMVIINFNVNESFDIDTTVLVSGASVLSVNGEHTVTVNSSSMISWPTIEPDGPITGTITVKVAPLGFTKQFSGTSLAAYKMMNPQSSGGFIRVDDTSAYYMLVAYYESMTDINTGLGRTPLMNQNSGICAIPKAITANTTATPWEIIGDDSGFIICTGIDSSVSYLDNRFISYLGDGVPDTTADSFKGIVTGQSSTTSYSSNWSATLGNVYGQTTNSYFINRSITGINGSSALTIFHMAPGSGYSGSASMVNGNYPALSNNGLILAKYQYNDGIGRRGVIPGILSCTQNAVTAFQHKEVIDGQQDFLGKRLIAITTCSGYSSRNGICFIDLTTPWR